MNRTDIKRNEYIDEELKKNKEFYYRIPYSDNDILSFYDIGLLYTICMDPG